MMFIRMTTGQGFPEPGHFPNSGSERMVEIVVTDDANKRVEEIKKEWPDFSQEFAELLGDILCEQDRRMSMREFKEGFQDVTIYKCSEE